MRHLQKDFAYASTESGRKKGRPPYSRRLSVEERAKLTVAAAGMPLGPFIKAKFFDGDLAPRKP